MPSDAQESELEKARLVVRILAFLLLVPSLSISLAFFLIDPDSHVLHMVGLGAVAVLALVILLQADAVAARILKAAS